MEKILRNTTITAMAVIILIILTSCGNKNENITSNENGEQNQLVNNVENKTSQNNSGNEVTGNETNKQYDLIGKKTTKDNDVTIIEEMAVKFKEDKVDEIRMTEEFENEEIAGEYYLSMRAAFTEGSIKLEGAKIIVTLTSKNLTREGITFNGKSKEETTKLLKESGYKIE